MSETNERRCRTGGALVALVFVAMTMTMSTPVGAGEEERVPKPLALRWASFDPRVEVPPVPAALSADDATGVHLVQLAIPARADLLEAIRGHGATIRHALPHHAYVVEMDGAARRSVSALPFVRWVGPYHPAYRLDPALAVTLGAAAGEVGTDRYNIQVLARGLTRQDRVARRIGRMGGTVHHRNPSGFRMEATLTGEQLLEIVRMDEVAFVDRWGPVEGDLDLAREVTGANYVEAMGGFTGAGVRGEVWDIGVDLNHCCLQSNPIILHTAANPASHGSLVTSTLFCDGSGVPAGRGFLPDGQPIFAMFTLVADRYAHTAELLDPMGPYRTVFQTSSVGGPRTTGYTTVSAEVDDIFFTYDLVLTQTQGNGTLTQSRPEAWAKNVVSVGGVIHQNTLSRLDDCWCGAASIGPATDGRIKPDFVLFFDSVAVAGPSCNLVATGGTSVSTPMVAGTFGLFFQMWSEGIFGNPADPGGTVFSNRPHMTTAKAMMINTATPYDWNAGGPNGDLGRYRQGWGLPDLRTLYDSRRGFFIVDEGEVLEPLEVAAHTVTVAPDSPSLRATLVYADPAALPASAIHRINDLTLEVTAPSGTVYYGNHGLLDGIWSIPGGSPDTINTVENVFVPQPEPGAWTVRVRADEINQDGHVETPALDADFALVVSGLACRADIDGDGTIGVLDLLAVLAAWGQPGGPADVNRDGTVDVLDLLEVLASWGACP